MSLLRKFGAAFAGALLALLATGATSPAAADTSWGYFVAPAGSDDRGKKAADD